jgi:hypothetical protein
MEEESRRLQRLRIDESQPVLRRGQLAVGLQDQARPQEQGRPPRPSGPEEQSGTRPSLAPPQKPRPEQRPRHKEHASTRQPIRRPSLPRHGQERLDAAQQQRDLLRNLAPLSTEAREQSRPPQRPNQAQQPRRSGDLKMFQRANLLACQDQLTLLVTALEDLRILSRQEAQETQPPVNQTAWLDLIGNLERKINLYEQGGANLDLRYSLTRGPRRLIAVLIRCIAGLPSVPVQEPQRRRLAQEFGRLAPQEQLSTLLRELETLGVISQQEVQRIGPPSSGIEWLQLLGQVNTRLDFWEYNEGRPAAQRRETETVRHVLAAMTNERVALFG